MPPSAKPKIAVFSGPTATIQNSEPLVTSNKARLLLMACLLRFGSLPPALDPTRPTPAELEAMQAKLAEYQAVFDTH